MKTITLFLMFLLAASSQTMPSNFAAAGLGFQSTATPQVSGWADAAHRNPDLNMFGLVIPSYLGISTDYTGNTTSVRANLFTAPIMTKYFVAGTKTGAGVSTGSGVGSSVNVGGAYDLGVWVGVSLSPIVKMPGIFLVGSVTYLKQDISALTGDVKSTFQALGSKACVRLGIGKTW